MSFWSEWWAWMLAALAFGILEVLLPSQIVLGFALGAGLVGLGLLTGLLGPLVGLAGGYGLALLLLLFALLSLGAWFAMRALLGRPGARPRTFEDDVND